MSDGKAHAKASKILAVFAGPATGAICHTAGLGVVDSVLAGFGAAVGCGVLGLVLGPDLDQPGVTAGEWVVIKRLGPLGWIFVSYWWLYAQVIPHQHPTARRNPLSHMPVVSTLIRLIYLLWFPAGVVVSRGVQVPGWAAVVVAGMVVGLMVSDTGHWAMDYWRVG